MFSICSKIPLTAADPPYPYVDQAIAPYIAPRNKFMSTEDLVRGPLPQFAYQLHLASGEVEKSVKDEQSLRQFLKGVYGARGPNGELEFDPEKGLIIENLPKMVESRLIKGKVCIVRRQYATHECRGSIPKGPLSIDIILFSATACFKEGDSVLTNDAGPRLLRQRVQQAWDSPYLYVCLAAHLRARAA